MRISILISHGKACTSFLCTSLDFLCSLDFGLGVCVCVCLTDSDYLQLWTPGHGVMALVHKSRVKSFLRGDTGIA